jgi:hypothetical protein
MSPLRCSAIGRLLAVSLTLSAAAACSGDDQQHFQGYPEAELQERGDGGIKSGIADYLQHGDGVKPGSSCEGDAVVECKEELPDHGDVINCRVGLQLCEQGTWSACISEVDAALRLEQRSPAEPAE